MEILCTPKVIRVHTDTRISPPFDIPSASYFFPQPWHIFMYKENRRSFPGCIRSPGCCPYGYFEACCTALAAVDIQLMFLCYFSCYTHRNGGVQIVPDIGSGR
jgi:hypothetical protein